MTTTKKETYVLDEKFTDEQKAFITADKKANIILVATAGSGKTFSAVERLKFLIHKGVKPSRIIFFSFTVAAVEELKSRINNPEIKITTIHAFCMSLLGKMGKFKAVSTFYDFILNFKEVNKPKKTASSSTKEKYYKEVEKLYEKSEFYSSSIAAYKLQTASNIKCRLPDYFREYCKFLNDKKARDFSDMLIDTRDLLKENKWLRMFRNQYDHIIIDEVQDVSQIQVEILLALNAECYTFIGDRNQSIFGFAGSNCHAVESMLKKRRKTVEMTLSTNFRSGKLIVENSNRFSSLEAIAFHEFDGVVNRDLILPEHLPKLLEQHDEIVILARTNAVIKEIERRMIRLKVPMRYFNYLTITEIAELKKGTEKVPTTRKVSGLLDVYGSADKLIEFIEDNQTSIKFTTSVHKFKGKESDACIIVNSISPGMLDENEIFLDKEQLKYFSFDEDTEEGLESKNVHYVAVSRARRHIYFMVLDMKNDD